jgi:Uma2 family endonuclease
MDAVTAITQMTATEFLDLPPRQTADRWELIDGEIVVSAASWMHGDAQGCIYAALRAWARGAPDRGSAGMPVDVQLDERNVFIPDVVWYRDGRVPGRTDPAPYPVPDLAVEVRSPSTWCYDIGVKKTYYEQHGVAELWLVDTAADVVLTFQRSTPQTHEFDDGAEIQIGDALTSPLLDGFSLAVGEIFAAPATSSPSS